MSPVSVKTRVRLPEDWEFVIWSSVATASPPQKFTSSAVSPDLDLFGLLVRDVNFDGKAPVGHVDGRKRLLLAADGFTGGGVDGRDGAGHAGFDLQLVGILAELCDLLLLALDGLLGRLHVDGGRIAEILFEKSGLQGFFS